MSDQELTPGGLLKPTFAPEHRRVLLYSPYDHRLIVISPFFDKNKLKQLGGTWHPDPPRGWSWYCNVENLEMLKKKIIFTEVDPKVDQVVAEGYERQQRLEMIRDAAKKDAVLCLRVPNLKTTEERSLRNYQKLGIQFGIDAHGAFLCGDEMGLGKTLQAIGTALWKKKHSNARRCLVIAPASVKYNWEEEIRLWSDETCSIIDGPVHKRLELWEQDTFFKVANPELIVKDLKNVQQLQLPWDLVIVDEIQMIKSWKALRSKAIKKLRLSPNGLRVGLSGTPIDGRLEDLHSIFEFMVPGLFPNRGHFLMKHAIKDFWGAIKGYKDVDSVRRMISPYFLRRLKKDVAPELPEKIYKTVYAELSPDERKQYTDLVKRKHEITEEAEAMTVVMRARQFCDAPALIDLGPPLGAKFNTVVDIVEEVVDNGHKALVFSMFKKMVILLLEAFRQRGWKCLTITGEVPAKERPGVARQFNEDPDIDLCVMDEAGAIGLNFQEASYVFHYDDNWAPAVMKQRTDRAHRLTSKNTVTVVNFVCRDTVEDRVRTLLARKDKISAKALGDNLEDISVIKSTISSFNALKLL